MYNKIFMVGKVSSAVQTKTIDSGKLVGNFRIETNDRSKQWHTVNVYDNTAEAAASFKEGEIVFVEGKLVTRSYQDRNGEKKYVTTVNAARCTNVCLTSCEESTCSPFKKEGSRHEEVKPKAPEQNQQAVAGGSAPDLDDIPF